MKHIMEASSLRQSQVISHITNPLQNFVRSEEAWPKFPTTLLCQRSKWPMQ
uniref:Uncharacterized protein n=1 Tax=Arundo donax TaxID=35708 RepID=A0A0A8ZEP0_ARUDO